MTDGDALFAAVLAEPDEDTPRLAYADWLDENGDPARAEFIRVQVALANTSEDDPGRDALAERERQLLSAHRATWAEALLASPRLRPGFELRLFGNFDIPEKTIARLREKYGSGVWWEPPGRDDF